MRLPCRLALPVLLLAVWGCGEKAGPGKPSAAPGPTFAGAPVVLISIDTLRSDRLPAYGYTKVETPGLDAFRKDAVLFERAYSEVPLTLPSHLTVFTGLPPSRHGVQDNAGYRLGAGTPTLAELLSTAGYETGGAVSAVVLEKTSGAGRGFTFYDDLVEPSRMGEILGHVQRPGDASAKLLLDWVRPRAQKPFLAFLHIYEPHAPYEPPEPFRGRYQDRYDGEVAASDAVVGSFLSELKTMGAYDRSLILVFSDHGEGLGDHGEAEHGVFLYREALQVPLLLKLPKSELAGRKVAAPVQLADIFTTVGRALGLAGFPAHAENVSLVDLAAGAAAPKRTLMAETFFPRIRFGWSELRSLIGERYHYIQAPRPELYDLSRDFAEKVNVIAEKPPELRAMVVEMERRRSEMQAPSSVDDEHARKLASLGYVSRTLSSGGALADPKDEIAKLEALRAGMGYLQSGRIDEALVAIEATLKANPRLLDAWEIYAEALAKKGRWDEAVTAMKKTVELSPPSRTTGLLAVANLCLRAGQPDEALRHARLAREMGDAEADEVLARVHLLKGDVPAAEAAAQASLARGVEVKRATLSLARVAFAKGDVAGSLALTDRILAMPGQTASLQGLFVLRGDALGSLGRIDDAEAAYRLEIERFPDSAIAHVGLAIVARSKGDQRLAARRLREMLEKIPRPEAYLMAQRSFDMFGDPGAAAGVLAEARKRFPRDPRFAAKGR